MGQKSRPLGEVGRAALGEGNVRRFSCCPVQEAAAQVSYSSNPRGRAHPDLRPAERKMRGTMLLADALELPPLRNR